MLKAKIFKLAGLVREDDPQPGLAHLCGLRADKFPHSRSLSAGNLWLLSLITLRLLRAPRVHLLLADDPEGALIRKRLDRRSFGVRTPLDEAASVLCVPDSDNPLEGSAFATLRRMDRKADKLGIVCRAINEPDERLHLLGLANQFAMKHPDPRHRRPDRSRTELCSVALWLGAFSAANAPLAISVTPVSGNVGMLRYFRTITSDDDATLARYALTAELIRVLSARNVQFIADGRHPIHLNSKLRHFATMVGFRIVRASLTVI